MPVLPLALDIAETVVSACTRQAAVDVEALAEALSRSHPTAGYSAAEVAEALKEELAAVGIHRR
jgi:SOS response regulatory protein OraA/RecX